MKILVTGGNGNISWWFVKLAVEQGHQVYALGRNFEKLTRKKLPTQVIKLQCDIRNIQATKQLLTSLYFDVVCDFICYNKEQAENAINIFEKKTNHYIFISSESIYKRDSKCVPFKETSPVSSVIESGTYIGGKIEAESIFKNAYKELNFPVTIIRPAYTYDTIVPTSIGLNCFTSVQRYIADNSVVIAGDGKNLFTFTHSKDLARALMGVIGNKEAIGEDYHITSDEWLSWLEATNIILQELNLRDTNIIHIAKDVILKNSLFGEVDLLAQKMTYNIFDNSKIKKLLPEWRAEISFKSGIKETLGWLNESSDRQRINLALNDLLIQLAQKEKYE